MSGTNLSPGLVQIDERERQQDAPGGKRQRHALRSVCNEVRQSQCNQHDSNSKNQVRVSAKKVRERKKVQSHHQDD